MKNLIQMEFLNRAVISFCLVLMVKLFKKKGRKPDRIEVYEETHKRKNGGYVDKASTEAMVLVIMFIFLVLQLSGSISDE